MEEKNTNLEEQITEAKEESAVAETKKKKKSKLPLIIILILLLVVGLRVGGYMKDKATPAVNEPDPVSVKVMSAEYAKISSTAPFSGRISPVEESGVIGATGQVTGVYVKPGDYVTEGTLLFTIDSATVAPQVAQAKAAFDLASTTYHNMEMLYNEGAVSLMDLKGAEVQYIAARETYAAASAALDYYNVTAPISGYVTSINVSAGNTFAGQGFGATIADTRELQIETTVTEYLAGFIKIGDEVEVYVSSLGDKPYKGKVTAFSPAPAYGTFTYPVTIRLDNESGELLSGMFAEIRIIAEESAEAICIPSDAVITKNGKSVAVILDDENIPSFVEVTTGIDNGEFVEIISGVRKGDTVVISGQNFVSEGTKVDVVM